ncbi:uncharacterized protein LOC142977054 [Anticarsia gemmatalis]|uniref:uncharacterized protein LOC142977054 n=1 Tax=Anticarsia gemmatalis TaxID=129554 RepID=UPI003F75C9AE
MDRVKFKVNGVLCSVGCEVDSSVMLVDYLRHYLELRGTKNMCREGGCGICTVVVTKPDGRTLAVNSCLISVTSCHEWDITTIEGLGNRLKGYHVIQKTLADNDGTQCGFCSPGWVMAMHGLRKGRKDLTMLEIEQSFGGNLCRCTGYRPILKAFKKFASNAPVSEKVFDIEDLNICDKKSCENCTCEHHDEWHIVTDEEVEEPNIIKIDLKDNKVWYKVYTLNDIFKVLKKGLDSYMLVAGNTAKGAYPIEEYPRCMIDITSVKELKNNGLDQNLIVGAGWSLSDFLIILQERSKLDGFSYLTKLYEHILKVAHIQVRNIGTIGGNLMIKHAHNEFPSDIFLLLETVGAQLTIVDSRLQKQMVTMQQFLQLNMKGKVILNVLLMPLSDEYRLVTYKIMPKAQNAHAIVNAGFLYQIKKDAVISCRIVYGGLSANFSRAYNTETYLRGKCIFTNKVLQGAIKVLDKELVVEKNLQQMSVEYRRYVSKALFYKGLLYLSPPVKRQAPYSSGAIGLHDTRPLSKGSQKYSTDRRLWPLNQPVQKVDGLIQCAGETVYTDDIPAYPREVFAAFALSTVAVGEIVKIDPTRALNEPGVVAFYSATDIPGLNSFTPADAFIYSSNEEVLAEGTVKYFNQPIGIVVAESHYIANKASKLVDVTYANERKPVLDIKEAKKDPKRVVRSLVVDAIEKGEDVKKVFGGNNTVYGQYHFPMETLVCVAKPTEEGISLYSATQWINGMQMMISRALNMEAGRIDIHVRRLGGAFGIKMSRSIQSAVACSLVVQKLNRPCRFIQPLTNNLRVLGKRLPCSNDYEVGVDSSGTIQYMDYTIFEDNGYKLNELLILVVDTVYSNCYDVTRWNYKSFNVFTDTAKNTLVRAPGTLEAVSMSENIMERIAYEMNLDPVSVRLANLDNKNHGAIIGMIEKLRKTADYTTRKLEVDEFNAKNRWKKRGLRFSIARFSPTGYQRLDVNISVFYVDGSIVITHAGVEMGQGLNTKAIQICAYLLNVSVEKIQIKENNSVTTPNSTASAGSITTQNITIALRRCCEELLERLKPIREEMDNPSWEDLVYAAYNADVDLQVHGFVGEKDLLLYNVYGVALGEVEVDILTGEYEVLRVDILQDVGRSISPRIDIGQVEGAFVMALGYWTCENIVYKETGELVTDRTWDYYIPQARDIPQDMRVYFEENTFRNEIILNAKGIGEPPTSLAVVVTFAIREAITSARRDAGISTTEWFSIDGPWNVEQVCMAAKTSTEEFKFS